MNKKILMITLMLMVMLTISIIPVQAAPKEKLDFELYWEAPIITDFDPLGLGHAGPKKSGGQDYPIQKTFHGRGISQDIWLATININTYDPLDFSEDFLFDSVGGFEFNWKTMYSTLKTKESILFEDGSTIELSIIERTNYVTLSFEGTFVGHGTGALKGVKIVGTTSGGVAYLLPIEVEPGVWVDMPVMGFVRDGIIMGWDGFP